MKTSEESRIAGVTNRPKRLVVTFVICALYLVLYISGYLNLRNSSAYIQPLPRIYEETRFNTNAADNLIYPPNLFSPRLGKVLNGFFLPLTWAEEKFCYQQIRFWHDFSYVGF